MRLWYQSFIDPEAHAPYFERLRAHLAAIAEPGTEWEVAGVRPPDQHLSRLTELRCSLQAIDHAVEAGERGFDAVVLGHFQDSGLWEARSASAVPVIGMGEAAMLHALTLGRAFGLVTIDRVFDPIHREQAERAGVAGRLVGVETMQTPVADLVAAFGDDAARAAVLETFRRCAAPLVAAGAEVVIPAGGLFGLLSAAEREFTVDGAVVLNPIAVAVGHAQLAVRLRALDGTTTSRAGVFARPPAAAIDEFRAAARVTA
jgi:Asp/Glu/hydantoin racemase